MKIIVLNEKNERKLNTEYVFDLAVVEVVILSWRKLRSLPTVWASDADSLSLPRTLSRGVTIASVAAGLCFPFHTRQLLIRCLQPALSSLSLYSSPLSVSLFSHFFPPLISAVLSLVLPVIEGFSTLIHCVWQVCGKHLVLPIIVLVTAVFFTHSEDRQIYISTPRSVCDWLHVPPLL